MYVVISLMPKVSCQEALNMLEKLETVWLQEQDVHVDELLHTRKLRDVATILKNNSLSQTTLEKIFHFILNFYL